ncbi:MAG: LysM peptidoglycan-binding domain-containing protein [Cytophagales bacterium]|nr:LysM peptidoglycan-binding domain-containing protein [Cytophagales bacterium]
MNRLVILLSFTLSVISVSYGNGSFSISDSIGTQIINGKTYIRYQVAAGETMYGICKKYKATPSEVADLNPELDHGLKVGMVINIPYLAPAPPAPVKSTAKEGESAPVEQTSTPTPAAPVKVVNNPRLQDSLANATLASESSGLGEPVLPRVLIVPFDPYNYFSDADHEIAKVSKMPSTGVRKAFRMRLNALLEPKGYETIHLLGGQIKDSITELNRVYSSVSYNYQDVLYTEANPKPESKSSQPSIFQKDTETKKNAVSNDPSTSRQTLARDESKYYGVKVKSPDFYTYFNNKYKIKYYVFVNQFEVKTDYEHCLDRSTQNYIRYLVTHYSIFDNTGKQVAGNRIKLQYNSNANNINKILSDNMDKVATVILAEIPKN